MEKFTVTFKHPCNFHSGTSQANEWQEATKESHPHLFGETLICLIDGVLYFKKPKHYIGVVNRKAAGGKWEKIKLKVSAEEYLNKSNAKPANFKGAPRAR